MIRHYFNGLIWKKTEEEIKLLNPKITKVTKISDTSILIEAEPKLTDIELDAVSEVLHSDAESPEAKYIEGILRRYNLI